MPFNDLTGLRRRFVLITFLTWLAPGLMIPGSVLIMTARGLDLRLVGVVFLVQGLLTAGLELPTGGLADVIGRRGVLAVSAVFGAASLVWVAVATTGWEFIVIVVLRAIARALSSGPAEAWYVDAVHAVDKDGDIRTGLAHSQTAGSVGLGAGTLVGGLLPLIAALPADGLLIPLSVPMLASAAVYAVLFAVVATGMREPARTDARPTVGALLRGVPATVAEGIRIGFRNPVLARIMLGTAVLGVALNSVELLVPGRMAALTGGEDSGATAYGVVTMIGFGASGIGSSLSNLATRLTGTSRRAAITGVLVSASGLLSLFATGGLSGVPGMIATGCGYAFIFIGLGIAGPVRSELVHHEVDASQRATVISIQSLALQGGGTASVMVVTWISTQWSAPAAWLVSGALLAVSAVLFRRVKARELATAALRTA